MKPIAQIEWDFRQIDDSALAQATLYEYARTSEKLRGGIVRALARPHGKHRARQHILKALIIAQRKQRPVDIRKDYPKGVWRAVNDSLLEATGGNGDLVDLLMKRPDFPQPWLSFPITYKPNPEFRRILITPMAREFERMIERAKEDCNGDAIRELETSRQIVAGKAWRIAIDWHEATVESIVADFEKWLRDEAKNHPEMKRRGRGGQTPVPPLAWLSAYRLQAAGYTYNAAQDLLETERSPYGHLPRYTEKSGWSDAVQKAKAILAQMESKLASN